MRRRFFINMTNLFATHQKWSPILIDLLMIKITHLNYDVHGIHSDG